MFTIMRKIFALFLATVVLFSSFSYTVEKHICMGKVTDVSFFNESEGCGMTTDDCVETTTSEVVIKKEKCCQTLHELIPGNQNEQKALEHFEIHQFQFVFAYAYTYLNLFEENFEVPTFHYFPPPLADKDINVLYQTFLI
jgi:hypothetical protein